MSDDIGCRRVVPGPSVYCRSVLKRVTTPAASLMGSEKDTRASPGYCTFAMYPENLLEQCEQIFPTCHHDSDQSYCESKLRILIYMLIYEYTLLILINLLLCVIKVLCILFKSRGGRDIFLLLRRPLIKVRSHVFLDVSALRDA